MAYPDMSRCPQTEAEFTDYFYTLIGRRLGTDSWDWRAVLSATYPWESSSLMIPEGVGPGIRQQPGAPFFGLTQQYSNGPKGRIFLPTAEPDSLGYYTRCIQYLDNAAGTRAAVAQSRPKDWPHDADFAAELKAEEFPVAGPKGAKSSGLVWAWYKVDGNAYVPIQGADAGGGGGGTVPPPTTGSGLTEAQVQAMIDASIDDALVPVYKALEQALMYGSKVALQINSGMFAGVEGGGPTGKGQPIKWVTAPAAHAWELVELKPEGSE